MSRLPRPTQIVSFARLAGAATASLCLLAAACGGSGSAADAKASCGPVLSSIAKIERSGQRSFAEPPARVIDTSKSYTATVRTDEGTITIDLAADKAPVTVNNFVFLSCGGFYDGLTFHRYEAGFVIQGGDPRGNGTGGPGYKFDNEVSSDLRHNDAGIVAMANSGPNTNGSQFYITLNPAPGLDGKYNVFGKVTGGMDVVRSVRVGTKIESISIQEK